MQFISWNVNGFRSALSKGFADFFSRADADLFSLQETKMQPDQASFAPAGYFSYFHSAARLGYSGTAVYSKKEPLQVAFGIEDAHIDEGRVITLEFPELYSVTCYSPNAQEELARIDYRLEFEDALREYLLKLDRKKPVVLCGDLNVAHQEIDLKNPKPNRGRAGFSDQERAAFGQLLAAGFTDSFRYLYPDLSEAYSWWSYRFRARERNAGWRIDYYLVSNRLAPKIAQAEIFSDVLGSDHCPVGLTLSL